MRAKSIVTAIVLCLSPESSAGVRAAANSALSFNGVTGRSTIAAVHQRFSTARLQSLCAPRQRTSVFVDGVASCDYLKVPDYKLAGYEFELSLFFTATGTLKTASLTWPKNGQGHPTAYEIENTYNAVTNLLVSKYGPYVKDPPCDYLGRRCHEWQMDGTSDWHTGGERIAIRYDPAPRALAAVALTYSFADWASFERF
jgi:hypothetical protein